MSQTFWLFIIFVFGLIFGSFLNVVIFRIDELETIWLSRSHCPKCKHILAWYDLVPFFSFVLLKTRCRYCKESISWQYPLVEIGTAFVLLITFYFLVLNGQLNFWAYLPLIITFGSLIVIFVYDLKTMTIPLEILLVGIIATIISLLIRFDWQIFLHSIATGLIMASIPLLIIALGFLITKREVMGVGDIFLAFSLGLLLNISTGIISLVISFMIGGIISIILILAKKIKLGKFQEIAFGPFLITGALISLIWGQKILDWIYLY